MPLSCPQERDRTHPTKLLNKGCANSDLFPRLSTFLPSFNQTKITIFLFYNPFHKYKLLSTLPSSILLSREVAHNIIGTKRIRVYLLYFLEAGIELVIGILRRPGKRLPYVAQSAGPTIQWISWKLFLMTIWS